MGEFEELLDKYGKDNTIKGRVKNPKTWVNLLILIIVAVMAVILIKSVMNSWSKDEIKNSIKIMDLDTKWVIKGVAFIGKGNKKEISIVPQVKFRIKNTGKRDLDYVRFIGNFVYLEKRGISIGDGYYDILKNHKLKPGEISRLITINSTYGYKTATSIDESYQDMFFNKKGWKKISVRISAKVRGTVKEIGEYPVKDYFDENFMGRDLNLKNFTENSLTEKINIEDYTTEWVHIKKLNENIFIPTVNIKLKNHSKEIIEGLIINAVFEYDTNKGNITQWKSKKFVKIDDIRGNSISNDLYLEAENGIRASSVEKFFLNKSEWKKVSVNIYIGTKGKKPLLMKTLKINQKVKGYKVRVNRG